MNEKRIHNTIALLIFAITYSIVSYYHEPWLDEAQAWQIAKYASYQNMMLNIGHYEGHPPLWYFILSIPAKSGIPYEVGLKAIGFIFSTLSAYLLIFHAPFNNPVKYVLPYTYFIFYQYGIIVRPYCVFVFLMLLLAFYFKERNSKPYKVVIIMALLCMLSAYGIIIAGSITIVWLFEIFKENTNIDFFCDKRFRALYILLCVAVFCIAGIIPRNNTYSSLKYATNSKVLCAFISMFTVLSDALIASNPWYPTDTVVLQLSLFDYKYVAIALFLNIVLFVFICSFFSRKSAYYFIFPYAIFSLFGGIVYMSGHHIGLVAIIVLFAFWVNETDDKKGEIGKIITAKLHATEKDNHIFKIIRNVLCILCLFNSLMWTGSSVIQEVKLQYDYGREAFRFLKKTGLDQLNVASGWSEYDLNEGEERNYSNINTHFQRLAPSVDAYYQNSIIYTFCDGYINFRIPDTIENEKNINKWRENGYPDVLLGYVDVDFLTEGDRSIYEYAPVFTLENNHIFKGKCHSYQHYIYLYRNLLQEYGLEEIIEPTIIITDEMRERYLNGEDMKDILEPYLDAILGK